MRKTSNPPARAVPELRNLPDYVAEQIRSAVLDGTYPPGARLIERKIAAGAGVSHIPVREALAKLVEEGLVERLPRRGARVVRMDIRTLEELSALRIVLEQFVVVNVQANWTAEHESELRSIVERMSRAARSGSSDALFALDLEFHQRLLEIADNAILLEIVSGLRGRISHFLNIATRELGLSGSLEHAESHRRLLAAISSGDGQAATSAVAEHIETATRRISATFIAPGPPGRGAMETAAP